MTDEQIIRAVAERVMGLILRRITIPESVVTDEEYWENDQGNFVFWRKDFNPLTDANHIMLVVEKMREKGWAIRMWSYLIGTDSWGVVLTGDTNLLQGKVVRINGYKIGHAVCLAALQAEGGE